MGMIREVERGIFVGFGFMIARILFLPLILLLVVAAGWGEVWALLHHQSFGFGLHHVFLVSSPYVSTAGRWAVATIHTAIRG